MSILDEVWELLLIDQSKVTSDAICSEEALSDILDRIERVSDSLRDELSSITVREGAIRAALAYNTYESGLWGDRASMAADDGLNQLTHEALKWKREHEDIVEALRDEQIEACRIMNTVQRQLAALQAAGAQARRRLALVVARK